jgi:hypothetical protein
VREPTIGECVWVRARRAGRSPVPVPVLDALFFPCRPAPRQTNARAQYHRAKQLPSMDRILTPYARVVGYPAAVSAKVRRSLARPSHP